MFKIPPSVEICTIGDEIISGKTLDSHSHWLSKKLSSLNYEIIRHNSIKDDHNQIYDYINFNLTEFFKSYNIKKNYNKDNSKKDKSNISENAAGRVIFLTGGLGPTQDDLTVFAVAEALKNRSLYSLSAIESINKLFKNPSDNHKNSLPTNFDKKQLESNENNSFLILKNNIGTAPGLMFFIKKHSHSHMGNSSQEFLILVLMPGVKKEMHAMFDFSVSNILKQLFYTKNYQNIINFYILGLKEAELSAKLNVIKDDLSDYSYGIYLKEHGIVFELKKHKKPKKKQLNHCNAQNNQDKNVLKIIKHQLKNHIICFNKDINIAQLIVKTFSQYNLSLSVAESMTAGAIMSYLSSVSNCSKVLKGGMVVYSDQFKTALLDIDPAFIDKHGAVSIKVTKKIAINLQKLYKTDYCLAITGYAGSKTPQDPNKDNKDYDGYMCVVVANKDKFYSFDYKFAKDNLRTTLQRYAVLQALYYLWVVFKKQFLVSSN